MTVPPHLRAYATQKATKAYGSSQFEGMSQTEMMAALMRKLAAQLVSAKEAFAANTLDVMVERNAKTFHILDVLIEELIASEALEDEEAKEPALFLLATYKDILEKLANILLAEDPAAAYDALIARLRELAEAWHPPEQAGEEAALEADDALPEEGGA